MPVIEAELFDGVRIVGGAPFRGGASEDIVFTMTGGAYTSFIGLARTDGCELERLSNEDGQGNPFFEGGFATYNLDGKRFVQFPSDGTVLTVEELQAVGTFECFGLSL